MRPREYPKDLIRECLANLGDAIEIQHHMAEALEPLVKPLGLGARYQLLAFVLGEPHRHHGFYERVFLWCGEFIEHRLRGSRAVIIQTHDHQGPRRIGSCI